MKKIYLAHSSKDKESFINKVYNILKEEFGEERLVYDVFSFNKSYSIKGQIKKAIEETGIFILFLSDNSINSQWVKFEIDEAIKMNRTILIINIDKINYKNYIYNMIINSEVKYQFSKAYTPQEAVAVIQKYYSI